MTAGIPTSGHFDCPAGYYCPSGTGLDWKPCPKGTYSQQTNLFQVIQDFLLVWVSDTHYTDGIRTKLIINTLYIAIYFFTVCMLTVYEIYLMRQLGLNILPVYMC